MNIHMDIQVQKIQGAVFWSGKLPAPRAWISGQLEACPRTGWQEKRASSWERSWWPGKLGADGNGSGGVSRERRGQRFVPDASCWTGRLSVMWAAEMGSSSSCTGCSASPHNPSPRWWEQQALLSLPLWSMEHKENRASTNRFAPASAQTTRNTQHTAQPNENCFRGLQFQMSQWGDVPILVLSQNTEEIPRHWRAVQLAVVDLAGACYKYSHRGWAPAPQHGRSTHF